MAVYDERDFNSLRYLVLLAAKPQGSRGHGRVWANGRGDAYMLTSNGGVQTVTSVADWLQAVGLLEGGPRRDSGGRFLVPTAVGLRKLEEMLRPGLKVPATMEEK